MFIVTLPLHNTASLQLHHYTSKEKFALYNSTVSRGGEEWCREAGKPIFHKMATWWSSKADGKLFFTNSQNILWFTIKNGWIKEIGHNQWLQVSSKDKLILAM